jgi:predicted metal-dependent hydrolase
LPTPKYIAHYPEHLKEQVRRLIDEGKLGKYLLAKYPKAFYALCQNIEPLYGQLEFDVRLYLTHLELFGGLY